MTDYNIVQTNTIENCIYTADNYCITKEIKTESIYPFALPILIIQAMLVFYVIRFIAKRF